MAGKDYHKGCRLRRLPSKRYQWSYIGPDLVSTQSGAPS